MDILKKKRKGNSGVLLQATTACFCVLFPEQTASVWDRRLNFWISSCVRERLTVGWAGRCCVSRSPSPLCLRLAPRSRYFSPRAFSWRTGSGAWGWEWKESVFVRWHDSDSAADTELWRLHWGFKTHLNQPWGGQKDTSIKKNTRDISKSDVRRLFFFFYFTF